MRRNLGLAPRLLIAVAVLFIEKTGLSFLVDSHSASQAQGLGGLANSVQHWLFRFVVSLGISAAVFAYLRGGRELDELDAAGRSARIRWKLLALHAALVLPLVPLSMVLYGRESPLPFWAVIALWTVLATLAVAALFAALAPWAIWRRGAEALGPVWLYAALAAAGAVAAVGSSQSLWSGMARVTFEAVRGLLVWVIPDMQIDPVDRVIDTGNFVVYIDPVCSGLEGMSLMVAFAAMLLILFRRDYIFPRALLVVPAGVLLVVVLNVLRIAALVLIGHAGHQEVAVYGFHSQAGWIAFNAASAAIALVSLRSPWLSRSAGHAAAGTRNPTAAYLSPFLALLLAGMLSKAASSGFETLYGLRLIAVLPALWYAWPTLRGIDWHWSWRAPLAGLAIFALWSAGFRLLGRPWDMPDALAVMSPLLRALWVGTHLLLSVALIPLAEELAFRGYLLRRFRGGDFEAVAPRGVGLGALLVSALAFGLCHGTLWLPGTAAGIVLGVLYMRTGRLGEAVVAHATVNALIATAVLGAGQWQLW